MGGPARPFPSTAWSLILATQKGHRQPLEALIHQYWKPAYCFLRACGVASVEDAKDLTQEFFARLLEKDQFDRLDPARGTFRAFLMRALKNFAIDARRRQRARGPVFALEECRDADRRLRGGDPDEAFRTEWIRSVLQSALDELGRRLQDRIFEVFRSYCLSDEIAETYAQLGARLGMSESDVRNRISKCRRLLREIIREKVREYVRDDGEVEAEFREIVKG
jgi:RNA polymerase sigma-70 factor (ECF subfamily)